jgi:hypothetical protein
VHAPGDRIDAIHHVFVVAQVTQVEAQQNQLLADVVVQLPSDPGALGFLRCEQAPADVAEAVVTGPELGFPAAKLFLSLPPPAALNEQPGDQGGLSQQYRDSPENDSTILTLQRLRRLTGSSDCATGHEGDDQQSSADSIARRPRGGITGIR